MQTLLRLSIIYIFGGTVGWISEFFFRRAVHKKWINPGFLVGTNLPLYGTGITLLYAICSIDYSFIPSPLWRNVFIIFVITAAMTAMYPAARETMTEKLFSPKRIRASVSVICPSNHGPATRPIL